MAVKDEIKKKAKEVTKKLDKLTFNTKDEKAKWGFLVGALYCLSKAENDNFQNNACQDDYKTLLKNVLDSIANGTECPKKWLSGLWFNSALQRIAAAAERFRVYQRHAAKIKIPASTRKIEPSEIQNVRKDVNALKHKPEGLSNERLVGDVNSAFEAWKTLYHDAK